jgi:putative nucleotidyltransferase with HDIG domain
MQSRVLRLYIGAMYAAAAAALALTDWSSLIHLRGPDLGAWAVLLCMGVLSESLAIRLDVGKKSGNSSITFIPLLASVQLFGPASAVVLMAATGAFGEFVVRRKEPLRATFNVAQWTIAASVAGWVFTLAHGTAYAVAAHPIVNLRDAVQFGPFIAFGVVFLVLNHAAVALVIALSQQLRFLEVFPDALGHSGGSLQDLLISPIAIAVAFLYVELSVAGIFIVLLPLLFIRQAYARMLQLRDANRDLLSALIKAIEIRDPYTSGHSLRVSLFARKIAELLSLPRAAVGRIEQAALLHDIGKVEAVYMGILMKPAALSVEERAIIESHVTKGEELLRNLSSVPEEVIRAVKHHHEREDGRGYPDGLSGSAIPIGAKIIAVCDAVDAMLSDRPYRSALGIPAVRQQLQEHAGSQFDPAIVRALLASDLLGEYADMMRASRHDEGATVVPLAPTAPWRRTAKRWMGQSRVVPGGGH